MIVVDRIDLDTQITGTFNAADVPNMVGVESREELQSLLRQDVRKVLITTIHKFGTTDYSDSADTPKPDASVSSVKSAVKRSGAWSQRSNYRDGG
jgi:type I site-specific restriction-modification system R (restriction) subunit